MREKWKRPLYFCVCAIFVLLMIPVPQVFCAENEKKPMAEDISGMQLVESSTGVLDAPMLFNRITADMPRYQEGAKLTLKHDKGIGSLYVLLYQAYGQIDCGSYRLVNEDTGAEYTFGEYGMIRNFLDLEKIFGEVPERVTLYIQNGSAVLSEIYAYTAGEVPEFIQKWEKPQEGKTDLILFSTHGDDEQLFFAGLLPYYGGELDYQVQVVYLTSHRNVSPFRIYEMLDGLWAVGIKTYPIFGQFDDILSSTLEQAYQNYYRNGITDEQLESFVVEQLRRFRPKVVVGHDIDGEYGHGMHKLYTDLMIKALEVSNDPDVYPELAEKYGVWDVPKVYIHLYPENQIRMNWDIPLERFGGKTAYQVTRDLGFPCHKSQIIHFAWYFEGTDCADKAVWYNPCEYGLYRSTVGEDVAKTDFFENVTTYREDALLEQQLREEEERRLEEERLAAEEAAATEMTEPLETTAVPAETEPIQTETVAEVVEKQADFIPVSVIFVVIIAVFGVGFVIAFHMKKKNKKI